MENFQDEAELGPQFVAYNDMIPHGAKVLEFQILCSNDNGALINPIASNESRTNELLKLLDLLYA